ncbi:MAG: amidase [Deltaproteobacteria bacterium]|nr:MAG: amidase [Deltaproteobacteria bacterium]
MFQAYTQYDALGLAEQVRLGETTPAELLETAIDRAVRLNPKLNAIVHTFFDRARQQTHVPLPDGPFTGVPFVLKDLLDHLAGEPVSMGSRGIRYVPAENSELVNRILAAGVIPFAKTNTPEFGLTITTEPKAFGPARNPWNTRYSTGGSSGGSAAAVAARIVPMASANDGGGSIRFPAACCGVFGLKPSRGLNPTGPEMGEGWEGAIAGHVISLSVRDSAAMLDATAGPEVGGPYRVSTAEGSYRDACQIPPRQLRIAYSATPLIDATVSPEAINGLKETARLLESLGHRVEEQTPAIDTRRFWRDFMTVVFGHTAAAAEKVKREFGKAAYRLLEPATRNMAMMGRSLTACDVVEAKSGWHDVQLTMGRFLTTYDAFLTPTLVGPPAEIGVIPPSEFEERLMAASSYLPCGRLLMKSGLVRQLARPTLGRMGFTVLGNITGLPSMSVPLHWTQDGLPLGMLFTGRMCDERTLFQLAGQLEQAKPWFDKRPPGFDEG